MCRLENHLRSSATLVSALALSCVLSPAALAQTAAPVAIDLDEITVSATLVPTEVQRSGASVSIIERDQIEASGTTQVSDLLSRLPGVSVVRTGGAGSSANVRIRGANPRYTAVYVDGIRIDDPSLVSVETDFGHLTLDDIDRIEVLRGSQSALYGGSAVAGVVNITTRQAEQDGFSHSFFAEGGSYRSAAAGYTLGYRDDRFETALTLAHRRTRGFTAFEGTPGTPGFAPDAERDGFESTRLTFSTRYRATDALTLGLAAFAQRSRNEFDSGFPVDPDSDNEARWRQTGARVFAELDTGAVQHTLSLSGYRITRDQFANGAFTNGFQGRRITLAYQGVADLTPGVTLVWGADTQHEEARAGSLPGGSERTRTTGAFLQALWAPTDSLDIGATGRVDHNSAFGSFVTGRLTAAWQVTPNTTLRGAVARGFRPPAIDERFGDYGSFVGNPALDPETSVSAEIGVDHVFAGGARIGATLFWLDTDNLITFDFRSPGPSTVINVPGTSRRRGLELSGSVPMGARATLSGSYTYTDARAAGGARLTRVPRHDLFLGVDTELANRLRGSLGVQHVAGRAVEFGTPFDDYTVVNASLRYAVTDRADVYLRIDNLLDRQYQQVPGYATPGRSFHLGVAARF
ncbi:MAG: TonB-dependent receptor [Pararhodobacter sp.]|nr:TonB-dependent receptor [Pararhodobacter sp.]